MTQTNTPTIDDMNTTIARFEGRKFYGRHTIDMYGEGTGNALPEMKYHTSWDWLMGAWEKAGKILYEIRGNLSGDHYQQAFHITKAFLEGCQKVRIESAHFAVYNAVLLIKWYNQQTTTNEG